MYRMFQPSLVSKLFLTYIFFYLFWVSDSFLVIVKLGGMMCIYRFILLLPINPRRGYKKSPQVQVTRLMWQHKEHYEEQNVPLGGAGVCDTITASLRSFCQRNTEARGEARRMSFSFASRDSLFAWASRSGNSFSPSLRVSAPLSRCSWLSCWVWWMVLWQQPSS